MKRFLLIAAAILFVQGLAAQALSPETLAKRAKRKNLTVKEWNTDSAKKSRWLDHLTVYDEKGRKIEETEYNDDGTKRKQYNYLPNGKLYTVKIFEYAFEE